jgi:hypothetical protein
MSEELHVRTDDTDTSAPSSIFERESKVLGQIEAKILLTPYNTYAIELTLDNEFADKFDFFYIAPSSTKFGQGFKQPRTMLTLHLKERDTN